MLPANTLPRATLGGEIEAATGPDSHPSGVRALVLASGNVSPRQVAGLKAVYAARLFRLGAWKTVFVHPAHLARVVSGRPNAQRPKANGHAHRRAQLAYAGRIQPVGFG